MIAAWALHGGPVRAAGPVEPPPLLVRHGNQIVVPDQSPLRERLAVADAAARATPHEIDVPAVVEADPAFTTAVLPPVTGRIVALKVTQGDRVVQGQLLASISSPDLAQAVSDVEKARDAEKLARAALVRAQGVNAVGANAAKDLEQAQSNLAQATSERVRAEERLRALGAGGAGEGNGGAKGAAQGSTLAVRAPVPGIVASLNTGNGSYVNDLTAPLMTISDLGHVWVVAQVPEDVIALIARGTPAEVELAAYPHDPLHGSVTAVNDVVDPDSHRTAVRLVFPNRDGRLKANMYATVRLQVPQGEAVEVPTSALLMNNDNTTVFVEVRPWVFERRTVELGREDGATVRIVSGLKAGERVVVRGGVLLND